MARTTRNKPRFEMRYDKDTDFLQRTKNVCGEETYAFRRGNTFIEVKFIPNPYHSDDMSIRYTRGFRSHGQFYNGNFPEDFPRWKNFII